MEAPCSDTLGYAQDWREWVALEAEAPIEAASASADVIRAGIVYERLHRVCYVCAGQYFPKLLQDSSLRASQPFEPAVWCFFCTCESVRVHEGASTRASCSGM